jgi:hypothetical protein
VPFCPLARSRLRKRGSESAEGRVGGVGMRTTVQRESALARIREMGDYVRFDDWVISDALSAA